MPANAADQTCTATGSGTNWELNVSGAPQAVGGYVAGFPGGTITGFSIPGFSGTPDTTGLPSGISNGLFTSIPAGRAVVLHVTTSGPPSGPFNVAFINQAQTNYGPLFSCPFDSGPGGSSLGGGIAVAVGDVNGDGSPDILVTTPGAGVVLVDQVFPRAKQKRLMKPAQAVAKSAGTVTVPLVATARGKALLEKDGSFTINVKVTFNPRGGKASRATTEVTFKKG